MLSVKSFNSGNTTLSQSSYMYISKRDIDFDNHLISIRLWIGIMRRSSVFHGLYFIIIIYVGIVKPFKLLIRFLQNNKSSSLTIAQRNLRTILIMIFIFTKCNKQRWWDDEIIFVLRYMKKNRKNISTNFCYT